ncbi:MAG: cyclic nucleotide-binding domain-containing protein [Proteobacteria bacterium]|nr:cyclic nucleotide-binding domain-containing protein [Pseudomonadota bacterium]MBS0572101.1 cyclic nucleotide-binding domain-containing protein [Pseudomonadota bacterium]
MLFKDEVRMLRQVPLFAGMEAARLKLLAFTSDRVSYQAGEILFHQGDIGDAAYVILAGQAEILADSGKGPVKVAEVGENSIVGEIAILCEATRTATVKAATPIEALRIRKEQFLKLLTDFPDVTIQVMRVLAERLSQTTMALTAERSSRTDAG